MTTYTLPVCYSNFLQCGELNALPSPLKKKKEKKEKGGGKKYFEKSVQTASETCADVIALCSTECFEAKVAIRKIGRDVFANGSCINHRRFNNESREDLTTKGLINA